MKLTVFFLLFSVVCFSETVRFPMGPSLKLTPGSFCTTPAEYRYRQRVPVCHRLVEPSTKQEVFRRYNVVFSTNISLERPDFKVDHFMPLCMGGSNNIDNLWPQHLSISAKTDDIEMLLCLSLQHDLITIEQAVQTIRKVKNDLSLSPSTESYLKNLLQNSKYLRH